MTEAKRRRELRGMPRHGRCACAGVRIVSDAAHVRGDAMMSIRVRTASTACTTTVGEQPLDWEQGDLNGRGEDEWHT